VKSIDGAKMVLHSKRDGNVSLLSKVDDSAAHFEDALAFCGKAGYRPEPAWLPGSYADMLAERNCDADEAEAVELLVEPQAVSTELGIKPVMARVR
jgi:hypothetical protein